MQQVDVGLAKLQVTEKAGDKRKIESTAIEGDQKVVGLQNILEFIHILTIDIVVGMLAVVETDHGNFMAIDSNTCGFDIQKSTTVPEISVESPAFRWRQYFVKIRGLVPVLSGFLEPALHQPTVLAIAGPMVQMQL